MTYLGESNFAPSDVRQLSHENVQKRLEGQDNRRRGLLVPRNMLALPRSHHHHSELVQCAAWAHPPAGNRDQTTGESNCFIVQVTSTDILVQKRALPVRGRDVPMRDILPTSAQHCDAAAPEFEKYIHGPEEVISHGLNERTRFCAQ